MSAFLDGVPTHGASRFGGGAARRPSVFGHYDHGLHVPVPPDPWHDEGGESGMDP